MTRETALGTPWYTVERSKADAVPPGWVCAKAKRFSGAPPVVAALLESTPQRPRKASAKRAAVHKGGL